jgi:hypothetical protein
MKHDRWFITRRFINWFPLGMTYAFLYMGRYNLNVSKNALGSLMKQGGPGHDLRRRHDRLWLILFSKRAAGGQNWRQEGHHHCRCGAPPSPTSYWVFLPTWYLRIN